MLLSFAEEYTVPPSVRIRELADDRGTILRISIDQWRAGAAILLERRDLPGNPHVILDTYGAELLSGFIIASRLALPDGLDPEWVTGDFGTEFQLHHEDPPTILLRQPGNRRQIWLPMDFWDRLYAELGLVLPHARALGRLITPPKVH